jgi:triosephosphate isomerase
VSVWADWPGGGIAEGEQPDRFRRRTHAHPGCADFVIRRDPVCFPPPSRGTMLFLVFRPHPKGIWVIPDNGLGGTVRTPLIAANWKMNKLVGEAVEMVHALKPLVADVTAVDVVVCPTFTALHAVGQALQGSRVELGAQDVYVKESGAYTGEISPQMLADTGCRWAIVGHSERRQYFKESDEFLNEKLKFAIGSGLKVMFCIGETLDERERGKMNDVLVRQVTNGFQGLQSNDFAMLAIAYEPVWAIGTGVTATPEQAEEAHAFVRNLVGDQFGATIVDSLRIQYGGSVKPENTKELMAKENVDGALVGGASLQADSFAAIVKASA